MAARPGGPGAERHHPLILSPTAIRGVLSALWAEVAVALWRTTTRDLTPDRIARNGPTCGILLAAYLAATYTALR